MTTDTPDSINYAELHQAWQDATAKLRREIKDRVYGEHIAALNLGTKPPTYAQRSAAASAARNAVRDELYAMDEHDGVINPISIDPVWGRGGDTSADDEVAELAAWLGTQDWSEFAISLSDSFKRTGTLSANQLRSARSMKEKVEAREAEKAAAPVEDLTELGAWLLEQTWSDFAQSLGRQVRDRGTLSPKQLAAAKSMRAKVESRKNTPEVAGAGLDLSGLVSGFYSVPNGDTRLKVNIKQGKGKWEGWTFVSDGAEYGSQTKYGSQRPDGTYKGQIEDQLAAILADPQAAQERYGQLTGTCGICSRKLEDEDSVARGIGPICARKWDA